MKMMLIACAGALAVGCATTNEANFEGNPTPTAKRLDGYKGIPVLVRFGPATAAASSHRAVSIRATPSNYDYFLSFKEVGEEIHPSVCSRQLYTGSRLPHSTCGSTNQAAGAPWVGQTASFFETIVEQAVIRHLKAGTLDLKDRPLVVDITKELEETDTLAFYLP